MKIKHLIMIMAIIVLPALAQAESARDYIDQGITKAQSGDLKGAIADFTKATQDLGINYLGLCCGAAPHHVRSMAEALGRTTDASRYSPDLSKHYVLGSDTSLKSHNQGFKSELTRS